MRADQVTIGDFVEYRGEAVKVVGAWRDGYGVKADGFDEPIGVELELAKGLVVRLVWPPMGSELGLEESLEQLPTEVV